jgi:ribosomal protein S18 acetylase RimI-like enzyme
MTDFSKWTVEAVSIQDLPSLGTINARAFHPRSEWHREVFPLSAAPWWEEKFTLDINDPTYRLLKISPPDTPSKVAGIICLRKYKAGERGAGGWSNFPPPPKADNEAFKAVVQSMVDYRERFMIGQDHMVVDHFGVDAEYQGSGLGSKLLARACELADEEKLDMFVEANELAESFYQRFGFKTEGKEKMPGGMTECFLIRRITP